MRVIIAGFLIIGAAFAAWQAYIHVGLVPAVIVAVIGLMALLATR